MKILSAHFVKSAVAPADYPRENLPEVAFAGRSNVGKSSLINILTLRKRLAKTSNSPGCTQLINFFNVNNRVSLVDLPGYGFARVPEAVRKQWGPMVETYLKEREGLRLVILVMDIRRDPTDNDLSLLQWFKFYGIPGMVAFSKTDKISKQRIIQRMGVIMGRLKDQAVPAVCFSSRTGAGREEIWREIENYV